MDFSMLEPDVWMVHWQEGRGEIELQDVDTDENLNGLRENFYDITPYVPLFTQFMQRMHDVNDISLNEAKKIQVDLINQLFEAKRQLPINYQIVSGEYWWDGSLADVL